jgi:hypothetical protein
LIRFLITYHPQVSRTTVVGREGVTPSATRLRARDRWGALWSDPTLLALGVLIALSAVGYGIGAGAFVGQVVLVWTAMTALHFGLVVLAWRSGRWRCPGAEPAGCGPGWPSPALLSFRAVRAMESGATPLDGLAPVHLSILPVDVVRPVAQGHYQ